SDLRAGDRVNMEADLLAKHVERLLSAREGAAGSEKLRDWLAEAELA
ncbi:MAG: riboflavin synthase, partial [Proteobacteria bacterium]|nr:riboflavin synthase [Pseudomonadota bacterium]